VFTRVEFQESQVEGRTVLDAFTLFEEEEGVTTQAWHLPLQAVADRQEIYGLRDNEHSLEFLGKARLQPLVENEAVAEVYPPYSKHLQQETRTLIEGLGEGPKLRGRTLLAYDAAASEDLGSTLDQARERSLQRLSVGGSQQRMRMFGAECSNDVVQKLLEVCDREEALLRAWRLNTAFDACPELQELMTKGGNGRI
jgi:hypothetical protein